MLSVCLYWLYTAACIIAVRTNSKIFLEVYLTLVFIDTFTWVIKSLTLKNYVSYAILRWVFSKWCALLIPFAIGLATFIIWDYEIHRFINWFIAILVIAELTSIIRNVYAIRTKEILPEVDVITLLIKKTYDFFWRVYDAISQKDLSFKQKENDTIWSGSKTEPDIQDPVSKY